MEIRQFEYFSTIVREGSFSGAARKLHVSQPALSKQVQALEHELGVALLIRLPEGVRPTDAGRRLHEMGDHLLTYLREIRSSVRAASDELVGTVTVGVSPSLVPALAEHLRTTLAVRHPGLRLQLVEAGPMFLSEWLDMGRMDVGLLTRWPPHDENPRLDFCDIGSEDMVLIGTRAALPEHLPVGGATAGDLAALPLALTPGFRHITTTQLGLVGSSDDLGPEIDSVHVVKALVLRGEYCSVMPISFVRDELDTGALRAVEFRPPVRRRVVSVTRSGRRASGPVAAVTDVARARLEQLHRAGAERAGGPGAG